MTDIDPAAVMAAHAQHCTDGHGGCLYTGGWNPHNRPPCEPYRLAEALAASEAKVARVRGYAAQRAIATHAKARPERERQWLDVLHMLDQPALADQPEQAS